MQMGIVVSGEMPHNTIVKKICENRNYTNYTGRDPNIAQALIMSKNLLVNMDGADHWEGRRYWRRYTH